MDVEARLEGCLPAGVIGMTGNRDKGRRGRALETPTPQVCEVLSESAWRMSCTCRATAYASEDAWGSPPGIRVSRWA
jgi:hypothetical protein